MRQVIAIVKPFLAEKILDGLRLAPLEAVHVREVKGMGRQKSYLDQYTESEYSEAFLPKVEITAWVEDSRAEEVIRKIVELQLVHLLRQIRDHGYYDLVVSDDDKTLLTYEGNDPTFGARPL